MAALSLVGAGVGLGGLVLSEVWRHHPASLLTGSVTIIITSSIVLALVGSRATAAGMRRWFVRIGIFALWAIIAVAALVFFTSSADKSYLP